MKITYVIDYLYSINGGTERQLYNLINGMVSRGHHVELFVFNDTDFTKTLTDFPCQVYCLDIGSVLSVTGLQTLWHFRNSLVTKKIDVVHGFFNDAALVLPPLMMMTGIKTYTSRRDMGIWYTRSKLYFLRLFRSTKTRLICNSMAVAKLTQEKEWKSREAILVIYNGMERYHTPDAVPGICEWAPKRGRNSETINVVLVANVRPVKRIEDLIMAANRLRDRRYRIQYYVVGHLSDKRYCDLLQSLLFRYRLDKDFHFIGPVAEPRCGLGQFDIGVLTSASEGFSNTIMEYMYAGLPVVASKVGGNAELVVDGQNGFLYEAGNVDALTTCLDKLASDAILRRSLAANSEATVCQFTSAIMVERHEQEYVNA